MTDRRGSRKPEQWMENLQGSSSSYKGSSSYRDALATQSRRGASGRVTDMPATTSTAKREMAKGRQSDDFFIEDNTEPSLNQLIRDSPDSIQVPDLAVDLNTSALTKNFYAFHDKKDNRESSYLTEPPKKRVKFTDADYDLELAVVVGDEAEGKLSEEEECSLLLSQSSDLERTTLETLLEAGGIVNESCEAQASSLSPSRSSSSRADGSISDDTEQRVFSLSTQASCLNDAVITTKDWADRSLDSLTTQYEDGETERCFDIDCLVDTELVESDSNIRLVNPLREQAAPPNTPVTSQSTETSAAGISSAMFELAHNSLDTLSLYSSEDSLFAAILPNVSQSSNGAASSLSSDYQVPISSEDELASGINQLSRRRRLLNSCAAQVVPDILDIEE